MARRLMKPLQMPKLAAQHHAVSATFSTSGPDLPAPAHLIYSAHVVRPSSCRLGTTSTIRPSSTRPGRVVASSAKGEYSIVIFAVLYDSSRQSIKVEAAELSSSTW
jgi:hypothetical protein